MGLNLSGEILEGNGISARWKCNAYSFHPGGENIHHHQRATETSPGGGWVVRSHCEKAVYYTNQTCFQLYVIMSKQQQDN